MSQFFMEVLGQEFAGPDRINIAPTQMSWIVRNDPDQETENATTLEATRAKWWLTPSWSKAPSTKYSMFNARSETMHKSSAYRGPANFRRCVVPISGYYEWVNQNGIKQPYYIAPEDGKALALAGLWDFWRSRDGSEEVLSFSIVTTNATESLRFVHHRQPVMLSYDACRRWASNNSEKEGILDLCQPQTPVALTVSPVSEFVNNTRNSGPKCLEAIGVSSRVAAGQ